MTGLAGERRSLKGQWCEGESSSRLAIVPSRLQLPAGGSRVCPACMMKWVHPGSEDGAEPEAETEAHRLVT